MAGTLRRDEAFGCVGDMYLWSRIQRMASPDQPHPLLRFEEAEHKTERPRVTLTETGGQVLSGSASNVALNGYRDDVAGVSMDTDASKLWYRQAGCNFVSA